MKLVRSLLITLLMFVILGISGHYSQSHGAAITVLKPQAGDKLLKGLTYPVTWKYDYTIPIGSAKVNIELMKGNQPVLTIQSSYRLADRAFNWTVPKNIADGQYSIRIITVKSKYTGTSNIFTIASIPPPIAGTIKVTSPKAGDTWKKGQTYAVNWQTTGNVGSSLKLELMQGTKVIGGTTVQAQTQTFNWKVSQNMPDGKYFIRLSALADSKVKGDSGIFTIGSTQPPLAMFTVTSPKAGDTWYKGQKHSVKWSISGISSSAATVSIDLYQGSKQVKQITPPVKANLGSFDWTVPNILDGNYFVDLKFKDNVRRLSARSGDFNIISKSSTPPAKTGKKKLPKSPSKLGKFKPKPGAMKTVNQACNEYANNAVNQQYANENYGCGFTGPAWNPNYNDHYSWCMRDNNINTSKAHHQDRQGKVTECACRAYEKTASAQNKENETNKCGLKGPMWSSTPNYHYNWCVKDDNSGYPAYKGNEDRKELLDECLSEYEVKLWLDKIKVHDDCDNITAGDWIMTFGSSIKDSNNKLRSPKKANWPSSGSQDVDTGELVRLNRSSTEITHSGVRSNESIYVYVYAVDCDADGIFAAPVIITIIPSAIYSCGGEEPSELSFSNDYLGGTQLTLHPGITKGQLARWKVDSGGFTLEPEPSEDCDNNQTYTVWGSLTSKVSKKGASGVKFPGLPPKSRRAPASE